MNMVSCLFYPYKNFVSMCIAYVLRNFWTAYWLSTFPTFVAIGLGYFVYRILFYDCFHRKYSGSWQHDVIMKVFHDNPWMCSLTTWVLILPLPLKIFLFSMTPVGFWEFLLPAIPVFFLFDMVFCCVGNVFGLASRTS
jgi:hypothetical protein